MRKILLTGASGFVGKNILKSLLNKNVELKIVLRENSYLEGKYLENCVVKYVKDIFTIDYEWWLEELRDIEIVIHSAWYVKHGKYLMSEKNIDCYKGTIPLIEAASKANVCSFVGIGSCYEYDFRYCDKALTPKTPLNPITPYSFAKVSLLNALKANKRNHKMNYSWCRLFYLYGEGEDQNRLIPYIHNQIRDSKPVLLSSPSKIRDYMNILKAAEVITYIALNKMYGEHNICSGEEKTLRQIAESIADQYGRRDLLNFNSKKLNKYDPEKIIGKPSEVVNKLIY